MKLDLKRALPLLALMVPVAVSGCVWKSDYEKLQAQNQQLDQQVSRLSSQVNADKAQIARLVGAIKYTVNSDLLFPSGGYQMSPQGKEIIARFASRLAPTQQMKLVVNGYTDNAPIGPALQREGITSNLILSQKARRERDAIPDLAGREAGSGDGCGPRRSRPGCDQQHARRAGAKPPGRADARTSRSLIPRGHPLDRQSLQDR